MKLEMMAPLEPPDLTAHLVHQESLDSVAKMEHLVYLVRLALQENGALRVLRVSLEWLEVTVHKDHEEGLDREVLQETADQLEIRVPQEKMAVMVTGACKATVELKVRRESVGRKEPKEKRVSEVSSDHQVAKVCVEDWDLREIPGTAETQGLKEKRVTRVPKESRVLMASQACRVQEERRESAVDRVHVDLRVSQADRDHRDLQAHAVKTVTQLNN